MDRFHVHVRLDEDVYEELYKRVHRKGDLSREVNDALRTVYLMKARKGVKP